MSDYPIRVEITRDAADELYDLAAESGCSEDWVRALEKIPRVPEPEQRACVGCAAWQAGPGFCKPGDLVADEATIVMFHPWWDISDAACPAWQPRRDKAEELAEDITDRLRRRWDVCVDDDEFGRAKEVATRVLREAGIGGESDE